MILADFGTEYSKIRRNGDVRILRTRDLPPDFAADVGCGHSAGIRAAHVVNELVALARGAQQIIRERDFVCVDVGSRDIKSVRFEGGAYKDCNLNCQCGAFAGFTIALLGQHLGLEYSSVRPAPVALPVPCGILGIATLFDRLAGGADVGETAAMFVKGVAMNVHNFGGRPKRLYLSGGLCENRLFVESLPCEVHPLGRSVLLEGLERVGVGPGRPAH